MVMDAHVLDRQFWAAREAALLVVDRHVALVFASVLVAAATYNVSVIAKLQQQAELALDGSVQAMLGLLALHVLLEFVLYCAIARKPRHYASHRSASIIAARSAALALMLVYVPRTWAYTVRLEMAAGKAPALAARLLVAGCMSASGVIETLCFRLRLRTALPYHALRWLVSLAPLPRLLAIFAAHAELRAIAESLWRSVTAPYGGAAALVLGLDLPRSLTTSASPCTVLVLMLWLHTSLALVVPLYVLALLEARSKAAFVAGLRSGGHEQSFSSGSGSMHGGSVHSGSVHGGSVHGGSVHGGSAASSSTIASGASSLGVGSPLLLGTSSGSIASPASGASDGTGVSASGSRVAALAAAAHGMPGEPPALSLRRLLPAHDSLALHCVILFCMTMAVWAICDAAVALWLHKPAARYGMCV